MGPHPSGAQMQSAQQDVSKGSGEHPSKLGPALGVQGCSFQETESCDSQ